MMTISSLHQHPLSSDLRLLLQRDGANPPLVLVSRRVCVPIVERHQRDPRCRPRLERSVYPSRLGCGPLTRRRPTGPRTLAAALTGARTRIAHPGTVPVAVVVPSLHNPSLDPRGRVARIDGSGRTARPLDFPIVEVLNRIPIPTWHDTSPIAVGRLRPEHEQEIKRINYVPFP